MGFAGEHFSGQAQQWASLLHKDGGERRLPDWEPAPVESPLATELTFTRDLSVQFLAPGPASSVRHSSEILMDIMSRELHNGGGIVIKSVPWPLAVHK